MNMTRDIFAGGEKLTGGEGARARAEEGDAEKCNAVEERWSRAGGKKPR